MYSAIGAQISPKTRRNLKNLPPRENENTIYQFNMSHPKSSPQTHLHIVVGKE